MARVLCTGAGGMIGGHLVRKLLDEGHFVRAVDIKPIEKWHQVHEGVQNRGKRDLRFCTPAGICMLPNDGGDPDDERIFKWDIDWVFHLASDMGGMGHITAKGAELMHNNSLIDLNVIEAARLAGVKRFFYSSSACVYPTYKMMKTDFTPMAEHEAWPADPNGSYGLEKLVMEELMQEYEKAYGMKIYIARFQNTMGPNCTWDGGREKAPAALCRKVAQAKIRREQQLQEWDGEIVHLTKCIPSEIEIWGDGEMTRSFMHVSDCVNAIYDLIQTDHHTPITLGPDETCSINELVDMIADEAGINITKKHIDGPEGVRGRHFDHGACRDAIGWVPSMSIRDGIGSVYRFVEEQVRKEK